MALLGLLALAACAFVTHALAATPPRTATLPAVSPDGRWIAYCAEPESGRSEVRLHDRSSRTIRTLARPDVTPGRPTFSANGLGVRYTTAAGDSLIVWEAPVIGGRGPKPIARLLARSAALSSDDERLAWTEGSWTRNRLVLARGDGARPRALRDPAAAWYNLAWSPDRRTLAATRRDSTGDVAIWLVGVEDGSARPLRTGLDRAQRPQVPAWSPDGRSIAFQARANPADPDVHLWVADVASGRARRIGTDAMPALDEAPAWLDRDHLVFQSTRSGRFEIWSIRTDGRLARCLTCDAKVITPPGGPHP